MRKVWIFVDMENVDKVTRALHKFGSIQLIDISKKYEKLEIKPIYRRLAICAELLGQIDEMLNLFPKKEPILKRLFGIGESRYPVTREEVEQTTADAFGLVRNARDDIFKSKSKLLRIEDNILQIVKLKELLTTFKTEVQPIFTEIAEIASLEEESEKSIAEAQKEAEKIISEAELFAQQHIEKVEKETHKQVDKTAKEAKEKAELEANKLIQQVQSEIQRLKETRGSQLPKAVDLIVEECGG
ncbi:MAG: ATP synthase F0 subunit B [Euryarchaeota archaeon]|nr:ATP synthase F0 subunit B [Euryarchaeota archaeon]